MLRKQVSSASAKLGNYKLNDDIKLDMGAKQERNDDISRFSFQFPVERTFDITKGLA